MKPKMKMKSKKMKPTGKKMSEEEIHRLSTPEERSACARYKHIQERCREKGSMGETDTLIASEAIAILVERNKRLGLIA